MTDNKRTDELKITAAMRRCKAILHKAASPSVLRNLKPEDSELPRYIAPTPMPLLRRWIKDSPDFWPWLVTPVDADSDALRVKELAYEFLVEVLSLKLMREDGSLNGDVLKAKQKAVDLILAKDKPGIQIANNTLHANTSSLPPGSVPRGLKGKSATLIEGKIEALEASRDEAIDVPCEEEL